jgi:hypothetical protein
MGVAVDECREHDAAGEIDRAIGRLRGRRLDACDAAAGDRNVDKRKTVAIRLKMAAG